MRALKFAVDGMLLLDKPKGFSSNQALQRIKWLFKIEKIGHTGTLDPIATGVLPLCLGEATKFSQLLLASDKSYQVTARLGARTITGDSDGEIIAREKVAVDLSLLETKLEFFRGDIIQTPPIYSAIKYQGKPLYAWARAGKAKLPAARTVRILDLKLLNFNGEQVTLNVHCSKGTYIRSLIDDLGLALGCGAYVEALRRTQTGGYAEAQTVSLERLEQEHQQCGIEALKAHLLPISTVVKDWPEIRLSQTNVVSLQYGKVVKLLQPLSQGCVWLLREDASFLGMGEIRADGYIAPKRLIKAA